MNSVALALMKSPLFAEVSKTTLSRNISTAFATKILVDGRWIEYQARAADGLKLGKRVLVVTETGHENGD